MYLIMLIPGCILPVYSGDSLLSSWIKFPLLIKKKGSWLIRILTVLSIETCWPYCSFSLIVHVNYSQIVGRFDFSFSLPLCNPKSNLFCSLFKVLSHSWTQALLSKVLNTRSTNSPKSKYTTTTCRQISPICSISLTSHMLYILCLHFFMLFCEFFYHAQTRKMWCEITEINTWHTWFGTLRFSFSLSLSLN